MDISNMDALAAKLAGVAGAVISMRFLQGSRTEKISMAVSGSVASYYAAGYLSELTGVPEGFMGFLLGVFGMAIASRGWEAVQNFPIAAMWQAVIDRIRGRGV